MTAWATLNGRYRYVSGCRKCTRVSRCKSSTAGRIRLSTGTRPMMRRTRAYSRSTVRIATIAPTKSIGTITAMAMRCMPSARGSASTKSMNTNSNSCTVSLATTEPRGTDAALARSSARVSSPSGSSAVACPVAVRNNGSKQGESDAERAVERPPAHPLDDVEAARQHDDNRNVDEVESLERDADLVGIRIHEQRGDRPERKQEREKPQPAPPRAARN